MDAKVYLDNSQLRVEGLHARSGMAEIQASAAALLPQPERDFELSLTAKHLHLCSDVFDHLPDPLKEKLKVLDTSFNPAGPAGVQIDCARRDGKWAPLASGAPSRVLLSPESLHVVFKHFQYPLERVSGDIELNLLTQQVTVNAVAYAAGQPVSIKGTWEGQG